MTISDLFKKKAVPGRPERVDEAAFDHEVGGSDVPVLVDFWASWCQPCQILGGLLEEIGPEYAGRIRLLKLNVEESPQIAARFGVRSIPTLIFFKNGKEVDRLVGVLPMNPLKQRIERHLAPVGGAAKQ